MLVQHFREDFGGKFVLFSLLILTNVFFASVSKPRRIFLSRRLKLTLYLVFQLPSWIFMYAAAVIRYDLTLDELIPRIRW